MADSVPRLCWSLADFSYRARAALAFFAQTVAIAVMVDSLGGWIDGRGESAARTSFAGR